MVWMNVLLLSDYTSISLEVALGNKLCDFHTVSSLESALGKNRSAGASMILQNHPVLKQGSSLSCSPINQSLNTLPWIGGHGLRKGRSSQLRTVAGGGLNWELVASALQTASWKFSPPWASTKTHLLIDRENAT